MNFLFMQGTFRLTIPGIILLLLAGAGLAQAGEHQEKEYEIAMTKGALQAENGDFESAAALYRQALEHKPGDKTASVSLGIAYSRLEKFNKAKEALLKARAADPSDGRTSYELGVVSHRLGDTETARTYLLEAAKSTADDVVVESALDYLERIDPSAAPAGKRGLALSVLAGLQHDSNVILEPKNPVVKGEKKSDWRAVAMLNAAYPFLKSGKTDAEAAYSFYQSAHKDLEDFNVDQHTADLSYGGELSETSRARFKYRYSLTYVGARRYSSIHQLAPSVTFAHSPERSTTLTLSHDFKKFPENENFPGNSDRNGGNTAAGAAHTMSLNKGAAVTLEFVYDKDSARSASWDSTGMKGAISASGQISGLVLSGGLSLQDRKYGEAIAGAEKRHDKTQELFVSLTRKVSRSVSLDLSDIYVVNDSNLGPFDYKRNIIGLFAVVSL